MPIAEVTLKLPRLSMPKLDGYELLAPIRAAELARRLYPLARFHDDLFARDPDVSAEIKMPKSLVKTRHIKNLGF